MDTIRIVNRGVDTLVVNVFHTDDNGKPIKRELGETLRGQLNEWKQLAQGVHEDYPTSLTFNGAVLHMAPNGGGKGQYPWLLKTFDITLMVSGGHWNGVASVRLNSPYLWSSASSLLAALTQIQTFVDGLFADEMYLQVSLVDLCADVVGWSDIEQLDRGRDFVSRSRKRGVYEETDWIKSRDYARGLQRTGFDFSRDAKGTSALSCRIYNKSRELRVSGKDWFRDLWEHRGYSDEDGDVWRVEFSFKREALHELQQEEQGGVVFHGLEDAYELPDRLAVLWAYASGQVEGGPDGLPDGWLRCVVPSEDANRSRWPTHPAWQAVQRAFLDTQETPPQFGKLIRKRWEDHNVDKGIEAVMGYLTTLAAWVGDELAEDGVDLSMVLHWLQESGEKYLIRVKRDFSEEVYRKRVKFGV